MLLHVWTRESASLRSKKVVDVCLPIEHFEVVDLLAGADKAGRTSNSSSVSRARSTCAPLVALAKALGTFPFSQKDRQGIVFGAKRRNENNSSQWEDLFRRT